MKEPAMLLDVDNVHVYYGKSHILKGVSFKVAKGEIVALLGRNGAGKTTTLKTVMGLLRPKSGTVSLNGGDITPQPAFKRARSGLGYVPQDRHLFPGLTVLENLRVVMKNKGDKMSLEKIYDLFPVLKDRLNRRAANLSGGEQQMVAIARALLTNPQILILDEPTTGLMPLLVSRLQSIVETLNEQGMTILLVEEKVPFALGLAQRIYFLEQGEVKHSGCIHELRQDNETLIRYLGVQD